MGMGDQRHAPAALPSGRELVPIVQKAGWSPGPVWTCAENLVPSGFDNQSLEMVAFMQLPLFAPDTVPSTCGTRTPSGTLRVSSCKQSYFEIIIVSQLNFKDVNRMTQLFYRYLNERGNVHKIYVEKCIIFFNINVASSSPPNRR